MLASGFPMAVRWGPDFAMIYNDGYGRQVFRATQILSATDKTYVAQVVAARTGMRRWRGIRSAGASWADGGYD